MAIQLGRAARDLWALRADASFLNHGSYGACPRSVGAAHDVLRAELESHPDAFMARIRPDGSEHAVRAVAALLARFVGSGDDSGDDSGDSIALVENATMGVHAALASMRLAPGDEVLVTEHQYNGVRLAVEARCREAGAQPRVVRIPVPTTADEITQRVLAAVGPRTRLVMLDHLTSTSALLLPLERLIPEFVRRGIPVIIDGAHALGQLPLNLAALDADWYVANAHKWLYSPRGCALLHAGPRVAAHTRPIVVSHYIDEGFPHSFDYTGTRDYTAWLALPAALQFHAGLDPARLAQHCARLVDAGSEALEAVGAVAAGPRELCAWMRAYILPQRRAATPADAAAVMHTLWERERIQIRCALLDGKLLLRFCAQAYVEREELTRLGEALERHGWPERAAAGPKPR